MYGMDKGGEAYRKTIPPDPLSVRVHHGAGRFHSLNVSSITISIISVSRYKWPHGSFEDVREIGEGALPSSVQAETNAEKTTTSREVSSLSSIFIFISRGGEQQAAANRSRECGMDEDEDGWMD